MKKRRSKSEWVALREEIATAINAGKTTKALAFVYDVSYSHMCNVLKRLGLRANRRSGSERSAQFAENMRRSPAHAAPGSIDEALDELAYIADSGITAAPSTDINDDGNGRAFDPRELS